MVEIATLKIAQVKEEQPLWFELDQALVTALANPLSCVGMYDSIVGDKFCVRVRGGVSSGRSFQSAVPTTNGA
jgi:hypothetical protein